MPSQHSATDCKVRDNHDADNKYDEDVDNESIVAVGLHKDDAFDAEVIKKRDMIRM